MYILLSSETSKSVYLTPLHHVTDTLNFEQYVLHLNCRIQFKGSFFLINVFDFQSHQLWCADGTYIFCIADVSMLLFFFFLLDSFVVLLFMPLKLVPKPIIDYLYAALSENRNMATKYMKTS